MFFKPDEIETDDESDFELTNQDEPDLFDFMVEVTDDDTMVDGSDQLELELESHDESEIELTSTDSDDSDDEVPENTTNGTSTRVTRAAHSSSNREDNDDDDDDDEEEDDVIQRILASSKRPKTHPPDISIDDYVVDLSFHPSNDLLAAGTMTGDVVVYRYSVEECEQMSTLEIHTKAIRSIDFDGEGEHIYSASKDRSIMITNVETGKFLREYTQAHEQSISKLKILDEHMFATGDDDGTVKVWDTRDRSQTAIFGLKEVDDYITDLLSNEAAKILLATSGDGYLTAINIGSR